MAAVAILKFCLNSRNSAIFAYIYTKFDAVTENDIQQDVLKSKFTSRKIQDGGGRHFEILLQQP